MSDESKKPREPANAAVLPARGRGWRIVNLDVLKDPPTALAASVYVVAILFALVVFVLIGFGLFASFQIAYETAIGKFDHRIEAAKVFFPILLALVGGPLLIWRVITAHIQAQATRHQADTGREAHYTSLFTKAVEQLGATREVKQTIELDEDGKKKREFTTQTEPNLEVRLGAIYALDRIARDSERDHWPIMEVLCAYIRNPGNTHPRRARPRFTGQKSEQIDSWVNSLEAPRVDVQAVLTVIGQRPEARRKFEADLGLRLDLRGASLQSADLNFGHFERATFENAALDNASFHDAALEGARFDQAQVSNAWFVGANLEKTQFGAAHLDGSQFVSARLAEARFIGASLENACLDMTDVRGARFENAHLAGAQFQGAELGRHVVEGRTVIRGASFAGAKLGDAVLFNTDLSQVEGLDVASLEKAVGDGSTTLPEGVEWPTSWAKHVLSPQERRVVIAALQAKVGR